MTPSPTRCVAVNRTIRGMSTWVRALSCDTFFWLLLASAVILLLPTLAMPLGADQATFYRGGRTLLEGGSLYHDFIDVKPPLVYLFYGIGGSLFGGTPTAIRLFDVLWQVLTVATLLLFLRHIGTSRLTQAGTVIFYTIAYTSLGHTGTAQAESVFSFFAVCTLYAVTLRPGAARDTLIGICCAIAFLLKYPLAIIGPAAILVFILRGVALGSAFITVARVAGVAIVTLAVAVWPFAIDDDTRNGFIQIVDYLRVYAGSSGSFVSQATVGLKLTSKFFGDALSLLGCYVAITGVLRSRTPLVRSVVVFGIMLVATVMLEGKYQMYHFSRLLLPFAIVFGAGLPVVLADVRQYLGITGAMARLTIVSAILAGLILSPLPRWFNIARLAGATVSNPLAFDAYLTRGEGDDRHYLEFRQLEQYLNTNLTETSRVLVVSELATPIIPFLPTKHVGPFADAHFYLGVGAGQSWINRAGEIISGADMVVVDTNDVAEGVTLHTLTSWQAIHQHPALLSPLTSSFTCTDTIASFFIFQRVK